MRSRARSGELDTVAWEPAGGGDPTLVFCHGFLGTPDDYRGLLSHIASHGIRVVAPIGHRRTPAVLLGRPGISDEAEAILGLVDRLDAPWVAGHSRGGQVAWLVAARAAVSGVVVVDPVDGEGRRGEKPTATARRATWDVPTTVIGAVLGGRCAPRHRNHERFASAAPDGSSHLVVEMGHADLLDGRVRTLGRLVCPGVDDPGPIPRTVGGLVVAAVRGAEPGTAPVPVTRA